MGEYDDLTGREKALLERLAEHSKARGVTTWLMIQDGDGTSLIALDGEKNFIVSGVPRSKLLYTGLAGKGFLIVAPTSSGGLKVYVQQPALQYAEYATKPAIVRKWQDTRQALTHESTLWAKIAWAVIGFLLGLLSAVLSAIALRLLGWIEVGN